jgi:BRCA1-associated protein 2
MIVHESECVAGQCVQCTMSTPFSAEISADTNVDRHCMQQRRYSLYFTQHPESHMGSLTSYRTTSNLAGSVRESSLCNAFLDCTKCTMAEQKQEAATSSKASLDFLTGNPQLGVYSGRIECFAAQCSTAAHSQADLPDGRGTLLCIISIPAHMVPTDMLQFVGPFRTSITYSRLLRPCRSAATEGVAVDYIVLLQLQDQDAADSFYRQYNSKQYTSMEEARCELVFVSRVHFDAQPDEAGSAVAADAEGPAVSLLHPVSTLTIFASRAHLIIPASQNMNANEMNVTYKFSLLILRLQCFFTRADDAEAEAPQCLNSSHQGRRCLCRGRQQRSRR